MKAEKSNRNVELRLVVGPSGDNAGCGGLLVDVRLVVVVGEAVEAAARHAMDVTTATETMRATRAAVK